jgi:hypothetical protein
VEGPGDADADKHLFAQDRLRLVENGCGALGAGIWGLDDDGKDDGAHSPKPDATMHAQATLIDGLGCLAPRRYCSCCPLSAGKLEEDDAGRGFYEAQQPTGILGASQRSWPKILDTACAMAKIRSTDYAEQASPRQSTTAWISKAWCNLLPEG